jgi:glyoxylase-like metal-dependent hydrolase (beta-lactamase superfamily II)
MTAKRMLLFKLGRELLPKSLSVLGADDRLIWSPIIAILVETADGWVLLETGIGPGVLKDPDAISAIYGEGTAEGIGDDPLVTALASEGLEVSDISLAAVSHLHVDHSGGLPHLAEHGVPVVIQRRELEFAESGRAGLAEGYYAPDYTDLSVQWNVINGDAPIAPGISALYTPGHTPGHMSYRIDLSGTGTWIMTVDAADLGQNLADRVSPGSFADPADRPAGQTSVERLLDEAERLEARIVPGHDMLIWKAISHPPGGHT